MVNVLISAPSAPHCPYLPYVHGILKTYADRDETLRNAVRWHRPIYRHDHPKALLEGRDLSEIDVLGLSCYTWNWFAQCGIGRRVKEANPDCWVIAGGPHCDYENPDFFRENPFLDAIVKQDGEIPFRQLLEQRVDGRREWEAIPGLYLRDEEDRPVLTSEPHLIPEEELPDKSPYVHESDCFEDIIREIRERNEHPHAMWETNRGCPFRCSFCDWGSLTFTKVRRFSMKRVRRSIEWFTQHDLDGVYLADANVGIFDRDMDIIDYFCECKDRHGNPEALLYNPTKSKADHVAEITRKLYEHDLIPRAILSVQHTKDAVLDAIDRKNLTRQEFQDLISFFRERDMPMFVQLIIGCPNDTYERWQSCMTDLLEWGIHGDFQVFNFDLLPNAPANDPEYREEWGIETTESNRHQSIKKREIDDTPPVAKKHLITRTNTFDEDDWTRMWAYCYVVKGFHSLGLTRKMALYLHYAEDVSFNQFYTGITDRLCRDSSTRLSGFYRRMVEAKHQFLEDPRMELNQSASEDLAGYPFRLPWPEWLFVKSVLNIDTVFDELENFVLDHFTVDPGRFRDLLHYQKQVVVTPSYSPISGKTFRGDFPWKSYFERPDDELMEPPDRDSRRFVIDQDHLGKRKQYPVAWEGHDGKKRVELWIEYAVREDFQRSDLPTVHEVKSEPPSSFSERLRRGTHRIADRLAKIGSPASLFA